MTYCQVQNRSYLAAPPSGEGAKTARQNISSDTMSHDDLDLILPESDKKGYGHARDWQNDLCGVCKRHVYL
jgi:hypothetical protein